MPFLYNVHTPSKTFALSFTEGEDYFTLLERIAKKSGLGSDETKLLKEGKDGSGVVYEFEGKRWSLEDDGDLQILYTRIPPSSEPSATLHLTPPHPHARFSLPSSQPPTAASALKKKIQTQKPKSEESKPKEGSSKPEIKISPYSEIYPPSANGESKSNGGGADSGENDSKPKPPASVTSNKSAYQTIGNKRLNDSYWKTMNAINDPPPEKSPIPTMGWRKPQKDSLPVQSRVVSTAETLTSANPTKNHKFPKASHEGNKDGGEMEMGAFTKPVKGEHLEVVGHSGPKPGKAASVRSTRSRMSKYGDVDAEPLWEVKKRAWHEFHNSTGVRTVVGKVGSVDGVRMLLKPGYKGVYVSRSFAVKHGLVNDKYAMGKSGYTGLKTIGMIPITVAGKKAEHNALISEEMHFDVVLGRTWIERMNIKVDPIDQTILTYMDNGETIPCDIVILKDARGNKIHVT